MPDEKLKIVFDCNIFVQALLNSESIAAKCFELVRNKRLELFISPITFAEVEEVLSRPNIINRIQYSSPEQIEFFLKSIVDNSTIIRHIPKKFIFERDLKDEPYINLAIAAKADYIVSRDKDLLDLMSGYTDVCKEFRQKYRPLKVIEPLEFLQEIGRNYPTA